MDECKNEKNRGSRFSGPEGFTNAIYKSRGVEKFLLNIYLGLRCSIDEIKNVVL